MLAALSLVSCALAWAVAITLVLTLRRDPRRTGPSLTGRTVVLERAGGAVNVRGIVVAQHADRWTLTESQAVGANGDDVPLEHPTIHVPVAQVLSVSEISADSAGK